MPYIKSQRKNEINLYLEDILIYLNNNSDIVAGDLNYIFTKIADEYLLKNGLNYQNINNVVGALDGAKLEFYRRVAAPYEDTKMFLNGDVYSEANLGSV